MPLMMLHDVTVFVLDSSEPSIANCRRHLFMQDALFFMSLIFNVRPIGAAFSEMPKRCQTKYYVQVDADMILKPYAIRHLHDVIESSAGNTAFACGWLWGDAEKMPIQGVKIFRLDAMKAVPYGDDYTFDFAYNQRLIDAGYHIEIEDKPAGEVGCLGLHHSLQTPLHAYRRWWTMAMKLDKFPEHYGYIEKIIPSLDNEAAILGASDYAIGIPIDCAKERLVKFGLT